MFTNGAAEPPDTRIVSTYGNVTTEPSHIARSRATDLDRDA